jgi:uncharacterized protein YjbI with pentapeptide repeats
VDFRGAELRQAKFGCDRDGEQLDCAQLQGAVLVYAQLQGANLNYAHLQGAALYSAQLQGATLNNAQLQGATLNGAQLQGAELEDVHLQAADIDHAFVWRATAPQQNAAKNVWGEPERGGRSRGLGCKNSWETCDWTQESYAALKTLIEREVPAGPYRDAALKRVSALEGPPDADDQKMAEAWAALIDRSFTRAQYLAALATTLQQTFCTGFGLPDALTGPIRRLDDPVDDRFEDDLPQKARLTDAFLDGATCPSARGLSENDKARLRQIRDPPKRCRRRHHRPPPRTRTDRPA